MPATGAAARPPAIVDEETFTEWVQLHVREVIIAVLVLVIIGGVIVLYRNASATQAAQAEQALVGPEQSITAGNLPLAQSDLRRVLGRYKGTAAAAQAAMLLAETYYDQQKYDSGLAVLRQASTKGAAAAFASAIDRLAADGYMAKGNPREAAARYSAAADATRYPTEKARLQASAARAYAAAGDTTRAVAIWHDLANAPKSGEVPEAQLMLGELTAKAAK